MKNILLPLLAVFVLAAPFAARGADAPVADTESPAAKEKRLAWFRHDKFGLFIHSTPSPPATGRARARPASASGS
jgi:uncharacterized membrane-anchored protein